MRGDEPYVSNLPEPVRLEFPACAGMNRGQRLLAAGISRVPRMRGDEPAQPSALEAILSSSPHARG